MSGFMNLIQRSLLIANTKLLESHKCSDEATSEFRANLYYTVILNVTLIPFIAHKKT